jgi:hypothetical protein
LLHISGNDKNKFIEYRDKAIAVFHKNMEQYPCLFHRVLLNLVLENSVIFKKEDFSIERSADRWDFVKNDSEIKKNMLRYGCPEFYYNLLQLLFDRIQSETADNDIKKIVESVKFNEEQWQTFFISIPDCFKYCEQKLITWYDEFVYLLKHSQMNHHHAELRTYYLWKDWLELKNNKKELDPFTRAWYYDPANSGEDPAAVLEPFLYEEENYFLDILYYKETKYTLRLSIRNPKGNATDLLREINEKACLKMEEKINGLHLNCETMAEAKAKIEDICNLLKNLPKKSE